MLGYHSLPVPIVQPVDIARAIAPHIGMMSQR